MNHIRLISGIWLILYCVADYQQETELSSVTEIPNEAKDFAMEKIKRLDTASPLVGGKQSRKSIIPFSNLRKKLGIAAILGLTGLTIGCCKVRFKDLWTKYNPYPCFLNSRYLQYSFLMPAITGAFSMDIPLTVSEWPMMEKTTPDTKLYMLARCLALTSLVTMEGPPCKSNQYEIVKELKYLIRRVMNKAIRNVAHNKGVTLMDVFEKCNTEYKELIAAELKQVISQDQTIPPWFYVTCYDDIMLRIYLLPYCSIEYELWQLEMAHRAVNKICVNPNEWIHHDTENSERSLNLPGQTIPVLRNIIIPVKKQQQRYTSLDEFHDVFVKEVLVEHQHRTNQRLTYESDLFQMMKAIPEADTHILSEWSFIEQTNPAEFENNLFKYKNGIEPLEPMIKKAEENAEEQFRRAYTDKQKEREFLPIQSVTKAVQNIIVTCMKDILDNQELQNAAREHTSQATQGTKDSDPTNTQQENSNATNQQVSKSKNFSTNGSSNQEYLRDLTATVTKKLLESKKPQFIMTRLYGPYFEALLYSSMATMA